MPLSFFGFLGYTLHNIEIQEVTGMRKRWILLGAAISLLTAAAVAAVFFLAPHIFSSGRLQMTLRGDREISVEYAGHYDEKGASAKFYPGKGQKAVFVPVEIAGSVDTGKPGTYLIKFLAEHEGRVVTAYRSVHVVDSQKPEIKLVSNPESYTLPGQTYAEEGFSAWDNYDGDLTHRVVRTETKEKIIYTVTDSFGNETVVERKIVYRDPEAPVMKLKGAKRHTMIVGQVYVEMGCTAIDNLDGDLSERVQVSGTVDRYAPGEYVLTYTVSDSFGNTSSIKRTVCVEPWDPASGEMPFLSEPNGKIIYLTFDDGPGKNTPRLLDVLKKYNVKATFFVVNTHYIDTIKRTAAEGHTVAIHTATHVYKDIYASEDAYFHDLNTMEQIILEHTGQKSSILRFPGGSSNRSSSFNPGIMTRLTKLVEEKGYTYFDWNVDSKDAGGTTSASQVFLNVTEGISKNDENFSVVLQHDIKRYSVDAVEKIIIWGLEQGYTFLPLDENSPVCHHSVRN